MTQTTTRPDRLAYYRDYYRNIMELDCTDEQRDHELATLMSKMEKHFRIPMLYSEEYNRKNPDIIALYCQVSASRKTLWS